MINPFNATLDQHPTYFLTHYELTKALCQNQVVPNTLIRVHLKSLTRYYFNSEFIYFLSKRSRIVLHISDTTCRQRKFLIIVNVAYVAIACNNLFIKIWMQPIVNISHATSCHGNTFRVTGPLWGESSGFPSQRASNTGFDVFFDFSPNSGINSRIVGDMRRDDAHVTSL